MSWCVGATILVTGQCLCGAIKYTLPREVDRIVLCHCKFCRRAHGSGFAASILVKAADLAIKSGLDSITNYEGRYFCSICATRLYNRSPPEAPFLNLMVATLDQEPTNEPVAHVNVSSKAPWFQIRDGGKQYPEFPSADDIEGAKKELERGRAHVDPNSR